MSLAEATVCAIEKGKKIDPLYDRHLIEVTLKPLLGKKWCWEVRYEWHVRVGGETGTPFDFRVFVLMNGKVIQPKSAGRWDEEFPRSSGDGKGDTHNRR